MQLLNSVILIEMIEFKEYFNNMENNDSSPDKNHDRVKSVRYVKILLKAKEKKEEKKND